jgi:hypothetical protein
MQERANRRRYLQLFGATVVAGVAGCTDSDTAGDDGSDGGSSDDGSASDGTDDGTTDDTDDGGPSDDGETDDSTDGDETDDGTDDSTDDDDGQTDEDTTPRLEDVFTWTDSYVMDIDASDFTGTWRFNDGDWYLSATSDGQTSELYTVSTDGGTDTYVVAEGQCFVTESVRRDPFDPQEPVDDNQEYVATGRTTIDGQDVYEFDVDDGIYYVSVATGYPVRYEGADGTVVRFHSWDETDPITPPEMECTRR